MLLGVDASFTEGQLVACHPSTNRRNGLAVESVLVPVSCFYSEIILQNEMFYLFWFILIRCVLLAILYSFHLDIYVA